MCRSVLKDENLTTEHDIDLLADRLPPGHTPIWIQPPTDATHVDVLERVETIAREYQDVLVLYSPSSRDEAAAHWCNERGWQYLNVQNIYGCEARCAILLTCGLYPEWITRGISMLIIVNNR